MTKLRYKKPEASTIRGTCVLCLKNQQKPSGKGDGKYKPLCASCDRNRTEGTKAVHKRSINKQAFPWRLYKKATCEKCGFIPQHSCQLDVDHIDGNKKNNNPTNYMTLCANCHRLKSHLNGDNHNH